MTAIEKRKLLDLIDRLVRCDLLSDTAVNKILDICGAEVGRSIKKAAKIVADLPAADVRPVVLCKDCVYWQKPQIKLNDGTYRDYELGEYENGSLLGGVTVDVGINIGSFCAKYNTEHQNRIPQFMDENDFCSKGYKLREES